MNSSPDISVIVRGGQIDQWLEKAVESVLASEDVSLQIILILNGPKIVTDETSIEAEEKEFPWLIDSRIKVFRFDHYLGMSGSIIEGISHADTEFIATVDGDDMVLPEKFSKQLEYLRRNPDCVLVGTRAIGINGEDVETGEVKSPFGDDVRRYLFLFNPLPHSSVFYRKSAYDLVGGHRPHLDQCEDYDLTLKMGAVGRVAQLEERLVLYRIHDTNLSKGATPRGPHIEAVTEGRRRLARALGVPAFIALPQHLAWLSIQYIRSFGLIRPLHEYSQRTQ